MKPDACSAPAAAAPAITRRPRRAARDSCAPACFGMSGGPEDKQAILQQIRPADVVMSDDAVIALAGATAGEPGIVTIAGTGSIAFGRNGTGSIAFGRNAAGRTARTGGWGYIFGDEGSGFDIARQAL